MVCLAPSVNVFSFLMNFKVVADMLQDTALGINVTPSKVNFFFLKPLIILHFVRVKSV